METVLTQLNQAQLILRINSQEEVIEQKVKIIQEQEQTIQERSATIQAREQTIQARSKIIQKQEVNLQEQEELIKKYKHDLIHYQAQIEQLKRMLFGQKRERFEKDGSQQLSLPFTIEPAEEKKQEEALTEKIEYIRRKPSGHKGRVALPDHLPVEEIHIHPEGNLSQMIHIGQEVTEELECVPARFYIRRYIRHKYVAKDQESSKVLIGSLPERVIDKGKVGSGLLASILIDKYMDHLPLYRQRQRFLREKIDIPSSTLQGWVEQSLDKLSVLYEHLVTDSKNKGYLQVDETTIRMQTTNYVLEFNFLKLCGYRSRTFSYLMDMIFSKVNFNVTIQTPPRLE